MLSRPGTNYTERSCNKRSIIDEMNNRNDSSAAFFSGESGFGGLSDIVGMPDFMPADPPINGGSMRFPSDGNSGNNRFPSLGLFGGDSMDRLPPKNNPPIRIPPSKIPFVYYLLPFQPFIVAYFSFKMSFWSTALSKSHWIRSRHVKVHEFETGDPSRH